MENFNQFNEYSKNEVNWRKSVGEISKFVVDHLDRSEFYDFLNGDEIDQEKMNRWQERLDELTDKITKRMGYRIDTDKLFIEAFEQIVDHKNSGELAPSKNLEYFCNNIDELKEKRSLAVEN